MYILLSEFGDNPQWSYIAFTFDLLRYIIKPWSTTTSPTNYDLKNYVLAYGMARIVELG